MEVVVEARCSPVAGLPAWRQICPEGRAPYYWDTVTGVTQYDHAAAANEGAADADAEATAAGAAAEARADMAVAGEAAGLAMEVDYAGDTEGEEEQEEEEDKEEEETAAAAATQFTPEPAVPEDGRGGSDQHDDVPLAE